MKTFLVYTNGVVGLISLFISVVTFVTMIVASYQGNIVPQGVFHIYAITLVVGVFTALNSIYLDK
uniref:Uncharacterized protein n=1 Tax=Vibrio phage P018-4 TaxID=3229728 RepID=A0AB39AJN2_9CAUD